jgi:ribulose-5-phosphate 4-epimerase/fuculose-1-phosphate aldolase
MNPIIDICQEIGRGIPYWVQGAGANVSFKQRSELWIKASGWRLDQVGSDRGWVRLNLGMWSALPEEEGVYEKLLSSSVVHAPAAGHRASMETGFHAALPKEWVLHFHSLFAVLVADHPERVRQLKELLGEKIAIIPRVQPGLELSRILASHRDASVFLLQGHGVILQMSENPGELGSLWQRWKQAERHFAGEWGWRDLFASLEGCSSPATQEISRVLQKRILPDQLALQARMEKLREPSSGDKDCFEILAACYQLLRYGPDIAEWTAGQATGIAGLEAEKFRAALRDPGKKT